MLSGFTNERVNFDIKYLNIPETMSRPKTTGKTLNIYKIRFNNIFKNEKSMYLTISVLLSLFLVVTTYTINYIYNSYINKNNVEYLEDTAVLNEAYVPNSDENIVAMSTPGSTPAQKGNLANSNYGTPQSNSDTGVYVTDKRNKTEDKSKLIATTNSKRVILTINDTTNANPFLPYIERKAPSSLPKPPSDAYVNSDANKVMKTIISGILYDKYNPSAILNIGGSDYLVKKGDVINQFKVLGISKNTVAVKLGTNIYSAGVGEIITNGTVTYNTVSNLNKKFGGSKGVD